MSPEGRQSADKKRTLEAPFLGSHLGINTKSSSTPVFTGFDGDGVLLQEPGKFDPLANRLERFALQSSSRCALRGSSVQRIQKCLMIPFKHASDVDVFKSKQHGTCNYSGLITCGSVWVCPVCAAKISERRRNEVKKAIDIHLSSGFVYMLTLTTPHYLGDELKEILATQAKALKYFWGDRAGVKLSKDCGIIGQIRALEVTHGRLRDLNNGWHPHYHILLFSTLKLDMEVYKSLFHQRWVSSCVKVGIKPPSLKHGVRLDGGEKAAFYLSKMGLEGENKKPWGFDQEITKGHVKKARDGETPFDLLRAYFTDKDKQAAALFREFAESFKGKRQLLWSPGLKAKFDISDISDEEVSAMQEDDAYLLGQISLDEWRLIVKSHLRGEVLELARHGWDAVQRLLNQLKPQNEVKI